MVAEIFVVFLFLFIFFRDVIKEYVRKLDLENDRLEIENDIRLEELNQLRKEATNDRQFS